MSATHPPKEKKKRADASPTPISDKQAKEADIPRPDDLPGSIPASDKPFPTLGDRPPTVPFRSFKIALSVFKDQGTIPVKFDRSIWSNKLYSTNLREILEAFRFLGLMDSTSAPTPAFEALVSAYDTVEWPAELRGLLERSFEPLLASHISTLTAGGLLKVVRTIYGTEREDTRKCGNFFIHAAREAAMDIGPFVLNSSRSRWTNVRRDKSRREPLSPQDDASDVTGETGELPAQLLIQKLPPYEADWPDDIKRQWFGAYNELILRLRN
jgi:hypothetical protein